MTGPQIYVKDSELRSVPSSFNHRLAPFLFAEKAQMPNSKGGTKSCTVGVTLAGLCFFRPSSSFNSSHCKVSQFLSALNICDITWLGPKQREVKTKFRSFWFSCEHADQAVSWILAAREVLFYKVRDPAPIRLNKFPTAVPRVSALFCVRDDTIAQVRYLAYCYRYAVQPSEQFVELFRVIDPARTRTLTLEETVDGPANLKCMVLPLASMDQIQVVHFRGFAPYGCCRAAHEILKASPSVRTLIFENYSFLIPAQLRMYKMTKLKQPLSVLFLNCQVPPNIAIEIIVELCKFPGEYQRLNFGGFQLNALACREIFTAIERARCFRTVEMIGFDDVNAKAVSHERIVLAIRSILNRCRFLQNVSFGGWSPPLNLQPSLFANSNVLHEVHLSKQDMSQTFVDFTLPQHIHLIEFSQCNFTSTSFARLFEVLSRVRTPLVLVLADLQIPAPHWRAIFASLSGYPKLVCLRELDWSGNQLPASAVDVFVDYFFSFNPIRFLGLDRIYRMNSITDMSQLFNKLPQGQLWGISICGNREWNFSGNLQALLQTISSLRELRMLRLDGQRFSDTDVEPLLDFLRGHQNQLVEFSCDRSALSTAERFHAFY
jgi:hypothetical protein